MASHALQAANSGGPGAQRFNGPPPYPPCIRAANELDSIAISQAGIETHHRGKRLVVRVITSPTREVGLMAAVEDEEGTATWLQLHNQPSEAVVPAKQTLQLGSCYLIKEPFATGYPDCNYSLRVDHPGDISLLPLDHELIPAKWRKNEVLAGKSREMRMKGNDAVGKARWAEAEEFYTTAARIARTTEEAQLAYLNRSLANLRLGRPATALSDAIKSYEGGISAPTEKALFREASALYDLAKYDQCLDRLEALRAAYPANNPALTMIARVKARLHEQQTGQYDFRQMHNQAEATPPLIDCATYSMPVEIRHSLGKGRGVFTKRKVLVGELLICEKAFGYIGGTIAESDAYRQACLRAQVVQKMFHNIEDARQFGDLHHGDYTSVPVREVDGSPVVDSFLVKKVVGLNSFGASRNSLFTLGDIGSQDGNGWGAPNTAIGVWSLISHINHSCIANASHSFIGDMQIARATRDLEEGSEVLFSYINPIEFGSYEEAQKSFGHWGFTCDCALCLERKRTPKGVLLQRESLRKDVIRFMAIGNPTQTKDIPKAQQTLDKLNQTYSAAARGPGGIRLEVSDAYFAMGTALAVLHRDSEAIEMIVRGLEALGFVISASPPRWGPESSRPEFQVKAWGLASSFSVTGFLVLYQAYKRVAPQLSSVVRTYLEVVHSIVAGEKETLLELTRVLDERA